MGRYPLKEAIGRYMESTEGVLADSTRYERRRKLWAFAGRYETMCSQKTELLEDPAKWTERELRAILLDLKSREITPATQSKELQHIGALLSFLGNGVLLRMKTLNPKAFPKERRSRGPCLQDEDMKTILKACNEIPGWRGEVAKFVMATYELTGLRLSELRLAEMEDLDLKKWTLKVRHPKGEDSYGEKRDVPIPHPLRPVVERYLTERDSMLAKRGFLASKLVLCKKYGNPDEPYSVNTLQVVKKKVQNLAGVEFQYRTLRRTYGQNLLDRRVSIDAVSVMLGHSTTDTTEKYYCRKRADHAMLEVLQAFEKSAKAPSFNPPLIDREDDCTGYA